MNGRATRRWLLEWAFTFAMLLGAALLVHVTFAKVRNIPEIFFVDQDFPALLGALAALALLAPLVSRTRPFTLAAPSQTRIGLLIVLVLLAAWAGRYLVFQNYSLSRDEEMAEFAAAYMREGRLAWPIPYAWIDYRRALVPEFFSPFGATRFWAATYLPVNSAIRAAFAWAGDANLAPSALLGIGLAALWHNARKLFPDRPDAVWVVMLMALTSAQLTVTAMTPYAMTGHFAFNMVWLAFVLRGDWKGYLAAAVVLLITGGMHQWHFVLIFGIGFLLWFALRKNWLALAFHGIACILLVVVWAKLWPAFLLDLYGPASDIRPAAGVADKVSSLFGRVFRSWYPFAYSVRFIVWNNLLLVPLAIAGVLGVGWRGALRSETPVLPLAIGCGAGAALMTAQVYGWGFRYMHGYIGSFCVLAGYGWVALYKDGRVSLRPVVIASVVAVCTTSFLAWRAHEWVAPYALSDRMIRQSDADVVLVDARGGIYASDLVRSDHGRFARPLVLSLAALDLERLDRLCTRYKVAIFDRSAFIGAGIRRARWERGGGDIQRAYLLKRRCGEQIRETGY